MKCNECDILLAKHAAGEITRQEEVLLEEHIRECPACKAEYASFNRIEAKLKEYPRVSEDPEMFSRVIAEIEHRQVSRNKVFYVGFAWKSGLAMAALIAVVFGYDIFYRSAYVADYEKIYDYTQNSFSMGADPVLKAALSQQQAKELSRDNIDYVTVASLENAVYSADRTDKGQMLAVLGDIVRRRTDGTITRGAIRTVSELFGNGVVAAANNEQPASVMDEIRIAVECEKLQNFDEAIKIYEGVRARKGIDGYTASMAGMLADGVRESRKASLQASKLTGDRRVKALVRSMNYMAVADGFNPDAALTRDEKFRVAVSLSKSGYGLKSALALNELKNSAGKKNDESFSTAVKMNLGVAAERSGMKAVAADCFKEINTAGLTAPVDMSSFGQYVKYVIEPGKVPPNIANAKIQPVRLRGKDFVQIRPTAKDWSVGETFVLNNRWKDYDSFSFDVYNPGKSDIIIDVFIRQRYNDQYGKLFRSTYSARPGFSTIAVDIAEGKNIDGESINWKKPIYQWYIVQNGGQLPVALYFNNFRLEREAPLTASAD